MILKIYETSEYLSFFKSIFSLLCWNFQERFPDPKSLVKDLHDAGFKAIWMLDPGIKQEDGYFVYDSGSRDDVWIQKPDGSPFVGIFSYTEIYLSIYFLKTHRPFGLMFASLSFPFFSRGKWVFKKNMIFLLFREGVAWTLCFPRLYTGKSSVMVGQFS